VLHKLVTGCSDAESLLDNKVTFITFNYDVSLEYQIFRGLSALAQFSENDTIDRFFDESRFIHIYGKVRDNAIAQPPPFDLDLLGGPSRNPKTQPGPPSGKNQTDRLILSTSLWTATTALFDTIYDASKGIRTIAPNEKTVDAKVKCARNAIADANCVYILGYGFDENNNRLLGLTDSLRLEKSHKTVMFTSFGNYNSVNKRASTVFFGPPDRLLSDRPTMSGSPTGPYLCEKSTRNVYDALALDFDSPEERLLSTTLIPRRELRDPFDQELQVALDAPEIDLLGITSWHQRVVIVWHLTDPRQMIVDGPLSMMDPSRTTRAHCHLGGTPWRRSQHAAASAHLSTSISENLVGYASRIGWKRGG
jgi:hypothetical protein